VEFTRLITIANMPIRRFGETLLRSGSLQEYLGLLRRSHRHENLESVMCRSLISVDWRGLVFDCDFNQMLGLPLRLNGTRPLHLRDLEGRPLTGSTIQVAEHCYGCTAGQGSSCSGALGG
jgi:radical SAM/Cys-rich protein